jgi:hypothetical protein
MFYFQINFSLCIVVFNDTSNILNFYNFYVQLTINTPQSCKFIYVCFCKHKLLTVLVISVSDTKKLLVKIVTIILCKFKNVCFGQLFKTYHNMFSAVLRHYLVTSKDRDCISVSRSLVGCCLGNVGHWYSDNISRSLPKVRRNWEIK